MRDSCLHLNDGSTELCLIWLFVLKTDLLLLKAISLPKASHVNILKTTLKNLHLTLEQEDKASINMGFLKKKQITFKTAWIF